MEPLFSKIVRFSRGCRPFVNLPKLYRKTIKLIQRTPYSLTIRDPRSGIRCLFDPWIRDPGGIKSQEPDPASGMNNPDHIS